MIQPTRNGGMLPVGSCWGVDPCMGGTHRFAMGARHCRCGRIQVPEPRFGGKRHFNDKLALRRGRDPNA